MGTTVGKWVEFKCLNDCQQMGCPSHHVRMRFNRSADVIEFEFDIEGHIRGFDSNEWAAMLEAAKA